jgi:SAM-dependent methyltransferase
MVRRGRHSEASFFADLNLPRGAHVPGVDPIPGLSAAWPSTLRTFMFLAHDGPRMARVGKGRARQHLTRDAAKNRRGWDSFADWFERELGPELARHGGMSWGSFHVPERRLRLLGDVRGKDVLELGCGAARWSIALARAGAHVVGLDVTPRRLEQARKLLRRARVDVELVEAGAEAIPLPDKSFDVIFCDIGAMSYADPFRTVPEAARLLRPGGQLTFSTESPIRMVYQNARTDRRSSRPQRSYFGMHRIELPKTVEFNLPYGEWIRLFRENELEVEHLIELPAPPRFRSFFLTAKEVRWARRWPWETIWSVRKARATHGVHRRET